MEAKTQAKRAVAPRKLPALALAAAALLSAIPARAEPENRADAGLRRNWPCSGCITLVPPSYSPDRKSPLLVALHGDGASTDLVVRMWKAPLERRGYLLLALRCPKDLGCENSFWRWHGDPAWIMAKVDAVEAAYSVDPSRIYLSGWSGGSTYMGLSASQLSPRFAAINLNGGGVPPPSGLCGSCKLPVYYFVGSKNPMISLAKSTADYFKRCGHELVWDLGPDLDHPAELQAIFAGPVAERVVAWLDTKRNTCLEPAAGAPLDARAEGSELVAGALPAANENPVELMTNTGGDVGSSLAEPAFGAGEAESVSSVSSVSSERAAPGTLPGGCGCRPAHAAVRSPGDPPLARARILGEGPAAWVMVLGLLQARRRSGRHSLNKSAHAGKDDAISKDRKRAV